MNEKDLIRKIENLRGIEPRKSWVLSTKGRILGEEPEASHIALNFFLKPAFALPIALLLIGGAFFYSSNLRDLKIAQEEYEQELAQIQELAPLLKQLQDNVSKAKLSLEEADLRDPKAALEMGKNLDFTVKTGKKVLDEAKKIAKATSSEEIKMAEKPKQEILTSIIETEEAIEGLESDYKLFVELLIEDVEHWYLGPAEQEKLRSAKENYEEGEYNAVLEDIYRISYPQQ